MIDHTEVLKVEKGLMDQPVEVEIPSSGTMTVLEAALAEVTAWADTGFAMGYADRLEGKEQRRFSPHLVPELFRARYTAGYQQAHKEEKQAQRALSRTASLNNTEGGQKSLKNSPFRTTIRGCSLKEGLAKATTTLSKGIAKEGTVPMEAETQSETPTDEPKKEEGLIKTTWKYFAVGITAGFVGGVIGMGMGLRKGMSMKSSLSSPDDSSASR